jgi:hypothetical protein
MKHLWPPLPVRLASWQRKQQWALLSIKQIKSAAWEWLHQQPQWAPQPAAQVQLGQHCDALCSIVIQLLLHRPHQLHQNCCPELWCHHHYSCLAEYLALLFGTFLPKSKGTPSCAGHALVKVFPLALVPENISGSSHSPSSTCKQTKQMTLYISASKLWRSS